MIKTLIVDDESQARARLARMIQDFNDLSLIGEAADGLQAVEQIESLRPDLILLDIQMPGLSGFEVLRALDPAARPLVIFVTAYDTFALDAFEVAAVDYLLKPVRAQRLAAAIERARLLLAARSESEARKSFDQKIDQLLSHYEVRERHYQRLTVRQRQTIRLVDMAQVIIIFVENRTVYVVTDEGQFWTNYSMKELEAHLDPRLFFRAHRQAFVNLSQIRQIDPLFQGACVLTMSNGQQVNVSRAQARQLREIIKW